MADTDKQRALAFGNSGDFRPTEAKSGTAHNQSATAYVVENHSGWLVYTRLNSCRAQLRRSDGWTVEQALTVARVLDGEVVL